MTHFFGSSWCRRRRRRRCCCFGYLCHCCLFYPRRFPLMLLMLCKFKEQQQTNEQGLVLVVSMVFRLCLAGLGFPCLASSLVLFACVPVHKKEMRLDVFGHITLFPLKTSLSINVRWH